MRLFGLSGLTANTRLALICVGVITCMIAMAFSSVPLYDLFCRVTGYGGTTQKSQTYAREVSDRQVTVRFSATTERGLEWDFEPLQRELNVQLGQTGLAYDRVTNRSQYPVTGIASYNVSPPKVGEYFNKIECFCFIEQTLQPNQSMDMPVLFFVDPELDERKRLDDIKTMTLSYTFFTSKDDNQRVYDNAFETN